MRNPIIIVALAAGLAACSSSGSGSSPTQEAKDEGGPRQISVALNAAGNVNPGPSGKAAPVSVKVMTLRSAGAFQSSDYFAAKGGSLGGTVIDSRTVSLRPGGSSRISLNTGADGAYVGVVAGFRAIDSARWRGLTSLGKGSSFGVSVGKSSVSVGKR